MVWSLPLQHRLRPIDCDPFSVIFIVRTHQHSLIGAKVWAQERPADFSDKVCTDGWCLCRLGQHVLKKPPPPCIVKVSRNQAEKKKFRMNSEWLKLCWESYCLQVTSVMSSRSIIVSCYKGMAARSKGHISTYFPMGMHSRGVPLVWNQTQLSQFATNPRWLREKHIFRFCHMFQLFAWCMPVTYRVVTCNMMSWLK